MKALLFAITTSVCAQSPLMDSIQPKYNAAKMNLIETAEAVKEKDYEFKLTAAQRTFAQWMDHNIGMNYRLCADIAGEKAPAAPAGLASKGELTKALKDSFVYCDGMFHAMTDAKALTPVEVNGKPKLPADTMISLLVNWNEHYGNLVGYLRTLGITPPTTARAQQKK